MLPPLYQLLQDAGRYRLPPCTALHPTARTISTAAIFSIACKTTHINKLQNSASCPLLNLYNAHLTCTWRVRGFLATAASLHSATVCLSDTPSTSVLQSTQHISVFCVPPTPPHTRILGPGGRRVVPLDPGCSSTSQPVNLALSMGAQVSCLALTGPGLAVWPLLTGLVILPEN